MKRQHFCVAILLVLLLAILACNLAGISAPTPPLSGTAAPPTATRTQIPPFPTGTPTATVIRTPTATVKPRIVPIPDLDSVMAQIRQGWPGAKPVGVGLRESDPFYLGFVVDESRYVASFAFIHGQWALMSVVPLEPTPTATPDDGAEEARSE